MARGVSILLFLQSETWNQRKRGPCPLCPSIYVLRQLFPYETGLTKIIWKHLFETDSWRDLGVYKADPSSEFSSDRGLECSKNQQLYGWDLDPKAIAPSMNKWECFFLIIAPDNDAYLLDLFED